MLNKVSATTAKEQRPVPQCSPTISYYSSPTNRMLKRLPAYENYDSHRITTVAGASTTDQRHNANIVSWLMQTDMKAKVLVVAL